MRDAARRIIRRVGVETGGSNIQFAVNPADGRMTVIEMNPRVSRSSALASKATGFPIAKIAAKLALGYRLDEIPNDITRVTPASFEPTIDYIVVKIPRWNFEKFPQADRTLTTQMKSVGEAMSIGRTFKEAFLKGIRSLEMGKEGLLFRRPAADEEPASEEEQEEEDAELRRRLVVPTDRRMWALFRALEKGWSVERLHELTKIDPWFLDQFAVARRAAADGGDGRPSRDVARPAARAQAGRLRRPGTGGNPRVSTRRPCATAGSSWDWCPPTSASIPARPSSSRSRLTCTAATKRAARPSPRRAQGDHPGQRAQPHRPGDRVRLLLLPCRLRVPEGGLRDDHDQLQSRDGVHRLRHRRPALLRAADLRRRDGRHREGAAGESRRGAASCSSAARRRSSWRCRCRRPA